MLFISILLLWSFLILYAYTYDLPPLTTTFYPNPDCEGIWRYALDEYTDILGNSIGTRLYKDITAPYDDFEECGGCIESCMPPNWRYPPASFSPGICPYDYSTAATKINGESDAACCPSGLDFVSTTLSSTRPTWFCRGTFSGNTRIVSWVGHWVQSQSTSVYSYTFTRTMIEEGTKFAWPIYIASRANEMPTVVEPPPGTEIGTDTSIPSVSWIVDFPTNITPGSIIHTVSQTSISNPNVDTKSRITPGNTAQIGLQTSTSNTDGGSKSSSLTASEIAAISSSISIAFFLAGIGIYIIRRRHLNHAIKRQSTNELGIPELDASSSYPQEIDAVEPRIREMEVVENTSWEAGGQALIAELEAPVERIDSEGENLD
ncbi:hypothetical protein M501DRAFT_587786 [Patellaria atrata CBS 101060]|uniref:Uncharacterized protein n=1 Tax=Patellaria atrata CBS 101060 TaxID=1346257 RepID=A0A9P4VKG7_9PEZI|nr:hypothetical protein M501DRAFT_587786 [Patellaria atrata CBS 101060]